MSTMTQLKQRRAEVFLALAVLVLVLTLVIAACQAAPGPQGPPGPPGPQGPAGTAGKDATLTITQTAALQYATVLSNTVPFPAMDAQRRGCPACHTLVDKQTGKYTLSFEAHERAEARGRKHPDAAPDGTSIAATSDVNVKTCLLCHASGTGAREGMGLIAPLSLRDIVHPAHMGSQTFKLHYAGQCFTCHNVNSKGDWQLLTDKVDVNDKGVPNPAKLPIPGAIDIP